MSRGPVAMAAGLVLLAGAACTGPDAGSREELSDAVQATRAAGTARVSLVMHLAGGADVTGEGVVDLQGGDGQLSLRYGQRRPIEVRFDDATGAYHWAGEWWGFERGETYGFASLIGGDVGMSDPLQLLHALEGAESVSGQASQDGGVTYLAQVPLKSVSLRALAGTVEEHALADVTVSTDAAGRVVRMEGVAGVRDYVPTGSTVDMGDSDRRDPGQEPEVQGAGADSPGRGLAVRVAVALTDFGVPVHVPMPRETTPMEDFPSPHDLWGRDR